MMTEIGTRRRTDRDGTGRGVFVRNEALELAPRHIRGVGLDAVHNLSVGLTSFRGIIEAPYSQSSF